MISNHFSKSATQFKGLFVQKALMDSLIQQIVLVPYSTPRPVESVRTNLEVTDTLKTLFVGSDDSYSSDSADLAAMLDSLGANLSSLANLQSQQLDKGPMLNLSSRNISLWLRLLADPTVRMVSLVPLPSFEDLSLQQLISESVDFKIAPDRAAWALHNYCRERSISSSIVTDELISGPKYSQRNPDYFSKYCYALYIRNLVDHSKILTWMIQNLNPENLAIFKKEILNTHSFLFTALNTDRVRVYIEAFKNELILEKSQLIQLSINSLLKGNSFQEFLNPLLTPELRKRVTAICNLTLSQLAFSSMFRNILFLGFPYFNADSYASNIKKMVFFSDYDKVKDHVLTMCKSVLWFDHRLPAVSSIVAFMIHILIAEIKKIQFPLFDFMLILYDNIQKIRNFSYLFAELQRYKFFNYRDFVRLILIKGYFFSKKEETREIIDNMPCTSQQINDLKSLDNAISKVYPMGNFNHDLDKIIGNIEIMNNFTIRKTSYDDSISNNPNDSNTINDIEINKFTDEQIELILKLPFVFRYQIAIYLMKKAKNFLLAVKIMSKIGTPNLIVDLFKRMESENLIDSSHFSIEIKFIIEDIIPCFSTRNDLGLLAKFILNHQNNPVCSEIALFLYEHYKSCSELAPYKSKITDIAKGLKVPLINKEQIVNLFHKYSHFCSLQIYDACFSVRTEKDFSQLTKLFIKDLLNFQPLTVDSFFQFFIDFSQSMCINRPSHFFMKMITSVIISCDNFANDEKVIFLLETFVSKAINLKIINPNQFLEKIFEICRKPKGHVQSHPSALMLVRIFIKILKESPSLFSSESLLTENIVKGFMQSFSSEDNPLIELLHILRTFPPPVITDDTLKAIESCSSAGLTYPAALFSLLPSEMLASDFDDIFDYFKSNVTRTTSTFWTLWLKLRAFFVPGFPVMQVQPDKEAINSYRGTLISVFSSLLYHAVDGDEKTLIYINCWMLLCDNMAFSKVIIENAITDLKTSKLSLSPMLISFLNPPLLRISEKTFETLCDCFCTFKYDDVEFEQYAKLSASVFTVFVSRFSNNQIRLNIVSKVLAWIPRLYDMKSSFLEYIIDVFNFILCFNNEETPQKDEYANLQYDIHNRIHIDIQNLPSEVSKYIIVNIPLQTFQIPRDPLYCTLESEPVNNFQDHTAFSSSDQHDSGYDNPPLTNDLDINPSFDDDDSSWYLLS